MVDVFSNISAGTEETSAITEEVHGRMERQMDDISEVTNCADQLHDMVGELQDKVSKFRV